MVLSLGFIIAFIGAAVALLIGILIFSEVEDAIICPAGSTPPIGATNPTGFDNSGSLGVLGDAIYNQNNAPSSFGFVTTTGIINQGVIKNGTSDGNTNGSIEFGDVANGTPSTWNFIHSATTGSNITSINFWLNGDVIGSPVYPIFNTGNSDSSAVGFSLFTQSGTNMRVNIHDEVGGLGVIEYAIIGTPPPDDSNWHMVTYIHDLGNSTGNFIVYCLDASCVSTGSMNNLPKVAVTDPVHNATLGGDTTFGGAVTQNTVDWDDVTIWNGYQLTQSDINAMWNGGSGSSGSSIASGSQVLHVSFDAGTEIGGTGGSPGSTGQGSEECENAKDIAWTVIGILPVALFFALFAIFGALGRTS